VTLVLWLDLAFDDLIVLSQFEIEGTPLPAAFDLKRAIDRDVLENFEPS
jgi:hypothetical protein